MAGRGRTSYQKRQKEQVRLERRQAKAARKEERKLAPKSETDEILEPLTEPRLHDAFDDDSGLGSDLLPEDHK